jgi:hypothetical protein
MKKEKAYWGRRASMFLWKDLNCALATLEVFQDMTSLRQDSILKAATGLEGGCVASGSTCGVLSGGALGLALTRESDLIENGPAAEREILSKVNRYVNWFEETYGTSFCRERSRSNFHTTSGLLRYLLPGDRVVRCMWHIRGALRYLYESRHQTSALIPDSVYSNTGIPFHCAKAVLSGVRNKTGVGNIQLERLSFVFDGGLGFSGGLCGALAGSVMAINVLLGLDVRHMNYWGIIKAFTVGHINLLKENPVGAPEPFMAGREVVENFRKSAGSLECREIAGKKFSGWDDFQEYISGSERCNGLIDEMIEKTSDVILRYNE